MRDWLVPLLACPGCQGTLTCEAQRRCASGVEEGLLHCQCGESYPIMRGVPRMLLADGASRRVVDIATRTRDSFGFEWTTFRGIRPEWEKNFTTYMAPLRAEDFQGKLVLDAGCGMGRHLFHAARGGGRVVGVDFSRAVEVAHDNTKNLETAAVIQADVGRLPFRPGTFDFIYCLGVLHHLTEPLKALRGLEAVLKHRGECRIYLYHQIARVPRWKYTLFVLASWCRQISTRLPHALLLGACWPLSAAIWVGCVVPFRLLARYAPNSTWSKSWLFRQYAPYSFMVLLNDQFDRFSAPIERRYAREEVEDLMTAAGLRAVVVTENFGWIGHGRKRDEAEVTSAAVND